MNIIITHPNRQLRNGPPDFKDTQVGRTYKAKETQQASATFSPSDNNVTSH